MRASYDARALRTDTPPRIQLVEVAPRDGLQAEARTLSTEAKVQLIERLADAGHTVIEATSFVNPKTVPQLADAEDLMRRLKRRPGVRYAVLVPNDKGLDRALSVGTEDVAVFASASESYSRKNLNQSRDGALAGYAPVIRRAKDAGARVRARDMLQTVEQEDGSTAPITGPAAKFSRTPTRIRHGSRALGADNAEILGELEFDAAAIARLKKSGMI